MSLSVLLSCASCAEQTDVKLCCARCRTDYCSRACQKAHWGSGGHKKACAGIARARRDTDLEVQTRALARVSCMSGGAPDDARCLFCLDAGDAADPLLRGCACRGSAGWTHATCLVKSAEAARVPPPGQPTFAAWSFCSTCKQPFTGLVGLRLAIAMWAKYAHLVETHGKRLVAASKYAEALGNAGEHAECVRLERGLLDVQTRALGPEHRDTLAYASNLAVSLYELDECAEAAVLLRTALAARTRALGSEHQETLYTEGHLVSALSRLGEHAEAEAVSRGALEKMRRVFGRDHRNTLATACNLATSLSQQGKHAEAMEIQREVLVQETRLLGAEHESTLITATNLACSLSQCGHKAEGEQLYRKTLALCRRVLGPAHRVTQHVLQRICALSPTV